MKKVSYSIMAHPSRREWVDYLISKLGNIPVAYDRINSVWDTCKRAWALYDREAEYHCVIQDDAIIGRDMAKKIETYLNKDIILSLYYGNRTSMRQRAKIGETKGYVISNHLNWGVAVCMRTNRIEQMIKYCDRLGIKQDDTRISRYAKYQKLKIVYTMPSLVNHRVGESLVGDRGRARQAYKFIGV